MDMKTTWVTFTATDDGFRARPVCCAPGTSAAGRAPVDGHCEDTAGCR